MTGLAEEWWFDSGRAALGADARDWKKFTQALESRFTPSTYAMNMEEDWSNLQCGPNESSYSYETRFRAARHHLSREAAPEEAWLRLTSGMKDMWRREIMKQGPILQNNVEETLRHMHIVAGAEYFPGAHAQTPAAAPVATPTSTSQYGPGPMEVDNAVLLKAMMESQEASQKRMMEQQTHMVELMANAIGRANNNGSQNGRNNRGGRGNYYNQRTSRECYTCGKIGHLARDCRHRERVQELIQQDQGKCATAVMTETITAEPLEDLESVSVPPAEYDIINKSNFVEDTTGEPEDAGVEVHLEEEQTEEPMQLEEEQVGEQVEEPLIAARVEVVDGKRRRALIKGDRPPISIPYCYNGTTVQALLDCGASSCFISRNLAEKLGLKMTPCKPRQVQSVHSMETTNYTVEVPVELGKWGCDVFAYVLPQMVGQELLLGMPFFEEYHEAVDFKARTFTPDGYEVPAWPANESTTWDKHGHIKSCSLEKATQLAEHHGAQLFLYMVREKPEGEEHEPDVDTREVLEEYADVIVDKMPMELPPKRSVEHTIDSDETARPPARASYRLTRFEWAEVDKQVNDLLERGIIRPSKSPYSAPLVIVKKKGGELRICTDYRALNELTTKDRFPLPRIDDILDCLDGADTFSKFDLLSGYWQVLVKESDVHKTAFSTRSGHYEYLVMPFGLCNAPATFQRLMNDALRPFLNKTVCVYLDDIIVFSRNREDHKRHVREVLDALRAQKFYAKKSKCELFRKKMGFLGHVVSAAGVEPDPEKVKVVEEWVPPNTPKGLLSFLGLTGYYRRFIEDYAKIAAPLTDAATLSPTDFKWTEACQVAFEQMKAKLVSNEVMIIPTMEDTFKVSTDACDIAMGGVLQQWSPKDQEFRPVAYESTKFKKHEMNYPTREKEFYAIIHALRKWRHYLLGRPFLIETDHQSLSYFTSQTHPPSGRLSRWLDFLAEYDFEIKYVPGKDNDAADGLSRMLAQTAMVFEPDDSLLDIIKQGYESDEYFKDVFKVLATEPVVIPKEMHNHARHFRYDKNTGLLYFASVYKGEGERLCVPRGKARKMLMKEAHDAPLAGHYGYFKSYERLARAYYWPRMIDHMRNHTRSCLICQTTKARRAPPQGLLKQLPVPTGNWQEITMDFIGGIPTTHRGHNNIWVTVDRMSKMVHLIPCKTSTDGEELADMYIDRIVRYHGVPRSIVSDRDKLFTAKLWQTLQTRLGTELKFSTVNHPQTDGQSERVNTELIRQMKQHFVTDKNWDLWLPVIEFAMNSAKHSSTGYAPFEAVYGYIPDGPTYASTRELTKVHHQMDAWMDKLRAISNSMHDRLIEHQRVQENRVNQHRVPVAFQINDQVLVHRKAFFDKAKYAKMYDVYFGPFPIEKKIDTNVYKVQLPYDSTRHKNINVQHLKKFIPRPEYDINPPSTEYSQECSLHQITSLVGIDDDRYFVTWEDCDPSIASSISKEMFHRIPKDKRDSLLDQWNQFIKTPAESEDYVDIS
ncbi:YALI0E14388p2 [Yarrowia lipolytica CLIB122]|uniref:RNA-directed DNA polymerase n=2 Tax=Yarrowia lipolytica TaxID=4952 RepID=B5FVH8_YARLI|nr:LOW QUALITY PROTEIN: YALI0E14388p2 [Yarrowia lipolytica CLIB122]CAR64332.1 YALI0E14388p2 [Yarrowia lipolytica CLIB122]|eukprot:XP_021220086.1 LOW QUALITY PROTEIN: YALI0E14388p2 [Yarrowia lipolytica CLIB122]